MRYFHTHPHLDDLEMYVLDRLERSQTHEIETHLLACARCEQITFELEDQIALIRLAMSVDTRIDGCGNCYAI